jgi:hypothetical protein
LWTGREVLLIGGSDAPVCPPNADCLGDTTPLADGAAYDPATGAWRRSHRPPSGSTTSRPAMVGQTAYVLHPAWMLPAPPKEMFAYDVAADRWRGLPRPGDDTTFYELVAAGDRLVALHSTDESYESFRPGPDLVFDAIASQWRELPDDPMGRAFNRNAAWFNGELLVFENKLVTNPGAMPTFVRSAALNLQTGRWRRLPDAPMSEHRPVAAVGSRWSTRASAAPTAGRSTTTAAPTLRRRHRPGLRSVHAIAEGTARQAVRRERGRSDRGRRPLPRFRKGCCWTPSPTPGSPFRRCPTAGPPRAPRWPPVLTCSSSAAASGRARTARAS